MAYLTHCCCGCMTVKTGTKVLAILSVIGFFIGLVTYSAICANFNQVLEAYNDVPELRDVLLSSYGLIVAYAVICAVGFVTAAICIRGAYTDQRHLLLPYLVFEGLILLIEGVTVIIIVVCIVASGALQLLMLLCSFMLSLALQIYFFVVVLSFYKQLAFAGSNPVGMVPGPVPTTYMPHPGYPAAPPQYQPTAPDTKMGMV